MPPLLRKDTIRLIEASLEALHLAISSLGRQKRVEFRQESAEYAIEIGLIGTAAELAMAACVIQARGPSAILWPSGNFKTAGQILDDFRDLVRDAAINSEFLVQGVAEENEHRVALYNITISFRRLMPVRAGGFHAGRGVLHEAAVVQAELVSDFLELLSKSTRLNPYLHTIPRFQGFYDRRTVIIEDIARRLSELQTQEKVTSLASLYLVLPDIPEEEPDWLSTLARVSIAPKKRDITYLLNVLQTALPANLRRAGGAGDILPVAVRQDDPDALPISPQHLRRAFHDIPDMWHADIATANGRLELGLDLPPVDAVREVFALGLERSKVLNTGDNFSAHQSWVHIAASLFAAGTPGPYWFIVRRSIDHTQLLALLDRLGDNLSQTNQTRITECRYGIDIIARGGRVESEDEIFKACIGNIREIENKRERLMSAFHRCVGTGRELPEEYVPTLQSISEGGDPVGPLLSELLESEVDEQVIKYWARTLSYIAIDEDDLPAMVSILGTNSISSVHTAARKAMRRIDFRLHGPPVVLE
jgi:hypothetical protein